jgi:C1A family cysteine protease
MPSPTRGGVLTNPVSTAAPTSTPGALGALPFQNNSSFFATIAPINWDSIITSSNPGPIDVLNLPGGSNSTYYVTHTNSSTSSFRNGTSSQFPTVVDPKLHGRAIPSSVDWRNRWGLNWLTTIQSQGDCGSCWSFATAALTETMVRIQYGMWSKRSEGDLRDSWGISCDTGNWPQLAAAWASGGGNGISDSVCVPYQETDTNYLPCSDRSGRSVRMPDAYTFQGNTDIQEQKRWLYEIGPLTCAFAVKADFDAWTPDKGVYRWDGKAAHRGYHAVLIVGYDDVRGCWILRNSWGKNSGDNGYYYVGYGEVEIDEQPKTGITNVDPDPWSRRRLHNGNMVQSSTGYTHRDLQLVRAGGSGGIMHIYRNGGNTGLSTNDYTWFVKERLLYTDSSKRTHGDKVVGQPTMLETSFNRNYEILYWENTGYLNHWYYNQNTNKWFCTGIQGDGWIAGYPGFVQTSDSAFAIVVRKVDGSLWHLTRDPRNADKLVFEFQIASGILQSGPALVEANIGKNGNLYVVAVLTTGQMQMFWRDTDADTAWQAGEVFGSGIGDTPPVMIQSHFWTVNENSAGAFQLVVVVGGQIQHWQRVNKDLEEGGKPAVGVQGQWGLISTFGGGVKHVWSLVHGSFNHALELVAEYDTGIMIHWRYTNDGWRPAAIVPGEK